LVQCAMAAAVRYNQRFRTFYERLKSRKGSAKAIVATAKEILVIIWYMLTRRELYRHMNKDRYEQKLSRIEDNLAIHVSYKRKEKHLPTIGKIPNDLWDEIKIILPPEKPDKIRL
jgi:hypothetical protein